MPDDPRESRTARLPGWEHEPGSDPLMNPEILLWLRRIARVIEKLRARDR